MGFGVAVVVVVDEDEVVVVAAALAVPAIILGNVVVEATACFLEARRIREFRNCFRNASFSNGEMSGGGITSSLSCNAKFEDDDGR